MIRLHGGSFTPPGSTCPTWTGVLPPGFAMTWFNDLNGRSGQAVASLSCVTIVVAGWDTGSYVPLDLGANTIHITADDGAGNVGRDRIVVTRILDVIPPTVVLLAPSNGATGVYTGAIPTVDFSERMNPSTINGTTITLVDGAGLPVPATVTYDDTAFRASVTTTAWLSPTTRYVLTVSTGVQDRSGNALAAPVDISFTTGP